MSAATAPDSWDRMRTESYKPVSGALSCEKPGSMPWAMLAAAYRPNQPITLPPSPLSWTTGYSLDLVWGAFYRKFVHNHAPGAVYVALQPRPALENAVTPADWAEHHHEQFQEKSNRRRSLRARGQHRKPITFRAILGQRSRDLIVSLDWLTRTAVFLAGPKHRSLRHEWQSHLLGESGHGLARRDQIRAVRGFLRAAVRLRLQDTLDLAWRPADAVLRSRTLSNLFVLIPTWVAALWILRHEGALGVLTSAEGISAIGGGLYGLVRVGRWWRDVKPPEPKARRVKE